LTKQFDDMDILAPHVQEQLGQLSLLLLLWHPCKYIKDEIAKE